MWNILFWTNHKNVWMNSKCIQCRKNSNKKNVLKNPSDKQMVRSWEVFANEIETILRLWITIILAFERARSLV